VNGTDDRPGLGQFLRGTIGKLRANLEVYILLSLLWAVVATGAAWPFLGDLAQLQQLGPQQQEQLAEIVSRIALPGIGLVAVSLLIYGAIYVVWVRTAALGRGYALDAGFARRYALVLWRTIALMGYGLLIFIGAILLSLLLGTVAGIVSGGETGGIASLLNMLLMLAVLAAGIPVYLAYSLAVVSSACDRSRSIIESLKSLQGLWWGYITTAFAGYLVFVLIGAGISAVFGGEALTVSSLAVSNLFNALAVLFVFAAGATAFEAVEADGDRMAGGAPDA